MATRKLAQPIPPSERPLSPSSAAKILPMVRLLLDAVSAAKTAAGISDSVREKIASLMASLVSILAHDDPLTFLVVGDNVAANGVPLKAEAGDLTAQRLNQIFQSHNIQSLTVKSGVEDREIELLVKAFAHLGDVHVGLLWPVWLGEHEIAHIYVEQQVKTARFIREGEGTAIRFSGMRGEEEPVGLAEQTDVSSAPTSKAIPPSAPASPAPAAPIKPAPTSRSVTAPPDSIASKEQRGAFLQAFEGAIAAGDRDAIQKMVDVVKACLTHASAEVRLGAAAVLEDVLPKCAAYQCEYLTEILVGILCEVMAREEDARVYGRLARIACDAAHDSLRRTDYDTVRRLVGALNRSDIGGISNRGVRAQQDSAINQLLNSVFFELLLDDLTSGEPARVSAATFVLSSFGDKAVPRVVRAIAESESMRARLALVPILKAQGAAAITYIRNEMLTGASALGGGGTTALKRLLTVIGELLPEARDILLSTLAHPSEDVAIDAVHVLSKLPPSECKVELVKLLEQPRAALRLEALRLIGAQKMTDLEGVVTQFLTKKRFRLEEELVREACITLGKLGAVGAVPTLCALLRRRGFLGLFGGVSPSVRAAAAWALGQIGDRSAVPYLKQAAGDRNSIVQGAAKLALQSFKM